MVRLRWSSISPSESSAVWSRLTFFWPILGTRSEMWGWKITIMSCYIWLMTLLCGCCLPSRTPALASPTPGSDLCSHKHLLLAYVYQFSVSIFNTGCVGVLWSYFQVCLFFWWSLFMCVFFVLIPLPLVWLLFLVVCRLDHLSMCTEHIVQCSEEYYTNLTNFSWLCYLFQFFALILLLLWRALWMRLILLMQNDFK